MPQFLGQKVRYVRQQLGLTQEEMARQLALGSYTHLTKIEAGQRFPSLSLIARFARLSSVTTDYLLRDSTQIEAVLPMLAQTTLDSLKGPTLLGEKLHKLRSSHNWTQTELAYHLGLARHGYISNLEAGRKFPSLDLLLAIADLFEVTTDYFLQDALPI